MNADNQKHSIQITAPAWVKLKMMFAKQTNIQNK